MHRIHIFIKIIDKEMIGLGLGAHIGKSSSKTLEAPRHRIHIFIKRIDKEMIGLGRLQGIESILL